MHIKLSLYWYFCLTWYSILYVKAVRQIRAMGVRSKIIGLTALITEADEQEFFAAGIDELFEKPLDPEWFLPIIREIDNQIWSANIYAKVKDSILMQVQVSSYLQFPCYNRFLCCSGMYFVVIGNWGTSAESVITALKMLVCLCYVFVIVFILVFVGWKHINNGIGSYLSLLQKPPA